ncbi:MAG: hypothetical protein WAU47_10095 [Desulfobaccales bacterium]
MNLMEILKKLGIIRCEGKAAVYTNAKDRPIEFMDEIDDSQDTSSGNEATPSPSE